MNRWSEQSLSKYNTLNPLLKALASKVLEDWDCTILWGFRTKEEQDAMCDSNPPRSYTRFPKSKHNRYPSRAIDLCPYPIPDWETDEHVFRTFGGYVLGVAHCLGIPIIWGGDWDSDKDLNDQTFNDLVHFELKEGV